MNRFILLVLTLVFALPASPYAGETLPVLRLASVDNIPPYVYREDGELTGLSVDIMQELARRGGFEVSIEVYPWARVLLLTEQGKVDGAFSAYRTEARDKVYIYTGIVHFDELRLAVKKGHEFPFAGIENLHGMKIGKGRGVHVSDAFNDAVAQGYILLSESDDMRMTNIKKLHEGRLDAVVGSPVAMMDYARKLGYDDIVLLPGELKEAIPAYLVLSRKGPLEDKDMWRDKLTRLLNEMHTDGTIADIYRKYGVQASSIPALGTD